MGNTSPFLLYPPSFFSSFRSKQRIQRYKSRQSTRRVRKKEQPYAPTAIWLINQWMYSCIAFPPRIESRKMSDVLRNMNGQIHRHF